MNKMRSEHDIAEMIRSHVFIKPRCVYTAQYVYNSSGEMKLSSFFMCVKIELFFLLAFDVKNVGFTRAHGRIEQKCSFDIDNLISFRFSLLFAHIHRHFHR